MKQMLFLVPLIGLAGLLFAVFLRLYVIRQRRIIEKMKKTAAKKGNPELIEALWNRNGAGHSSRRLRMLSRGLRTAK